MKIILSVTLIASISVMGIWLFRLYNQKVLLSGDLQEVNDMIAPLTKENSQLVKEIEYLQNPDNLEKEFRAQFNYVKPGEKLIIVVPKQ